MAYTGQVLGLRLRVLIFGKYTTEKEVTNSPHSRPQQRDREREYFDYFTLLTAPYRLFIHINVLTNVSSI